MNTLIDYFEKVFFYANQTSKPTSPITNLQPNQLVSFFSIQASNNILYITVNNNMIQTNFILHNKLMSILSAANYYHVVFNGKEFVLSGNFLKKLFINLSKTNLQFYKLDRNLLQRLELKTKNIKQAEFLYLFAKNVVNDKNVIKESAMINTEFDISLLAGNILDILNHLVALIKPLLGVSANILFTFFKSILPEAYARFFTGVGITLPYTIFASKVAAYAARLIFETRGLSRFIPLTVIMMGIAVFNTATASVVHGFVSPNLNFNVDIKFGLGTAFLFIGNMILVRFLMSRFKIGVDEQAKNMAAKLHS
jgi:hypothetical protein